jgi:FkbM family methyltransferase
MDVNRYTVLTKRRLRGTLNRLGLDVRKMSSRPFGEEPWLDVDRLAAAWNTPITTILDVGANVGETSLTLHERFPHARVLAFEPHPATFERLRENVEGEGIVPFNLALGSTSRLAELFVYRFSTLNSLIEDAPYPVRFGEAATSVPVVVHTLDRFCSDNEVAAVDLLKIDTEGTDVDVLRGAERLLREGRIRFVVTEFNDLRERHGAQGGALLPIADFLYPFGFRLIAGYTEQVFPDGDLFVVSNALFALPVEHRVEQTPVPTRPVTAVERSRDRRVPRAPTRVAVLALVLLLMLVALPEVFGDRPFDPRPTRVLPHVHIWPSGEPASPFVAT